MSAASPAGVARREGRSDLRVLVFAFLLARLLAWAFLLPPWGGFDEPQHQGYVESCREKVFWPAYRSITIPDRLIAEIHRWPLPHRGLLAFPEGMGEPAPAVRAPIPNYETLQSPLYYLAAGRALALLPSLRPIDELYLLRLASVVMAFVVGWLACRSAAALGFGPEAWLPAAFLAFVPGFGIAMVRVTNDAFCALLLSVALSATAGFPRASRRSALTASFAGGLAPWAKLFGWAGVPSVGAWALRRGSSRLARLACLALLLVPGLLLAWGSWKINGQALPIQENLRAAGSPPLSEIPWLRDAWAIAKTFVWVSGASSLVFPNGIYLVSVIVLAASLVLTLTTVRNGQEKLLFLGLPVLLFGFALTYHSWRVFGAYGKSGSAGWYLWALALPLGLLTTWGLARSRRARQLLPLALASLGTCVLPRADGPRGRGPGSRCRGGVARHAEPALDGSARARCVRPPPPFLRLATGGRGRGGARLRRGILAAGRRRDRPLLQAAGELTRADWIASSIRARTEDPSRRASSGESPAVETGGSTRSVAVEGRNTKERLGSDCAAPAMASGTTSTPASIASRKAPSRNWPSVPSALRVPSGNRMTETPLFRIRRIRSIASRALSRSPRTIGTSPATRSCQPSSGIEKIAFFESHFISHGRRATRKTSVNELWFATKTCGRRGSIASAPSIRKVQKGVRLPAATAEEWKTRPTRRRFRSKGKVARRKRRTSGVQRMTMRT